MGFDRKNWDGTPRIPEEPGKELIRKALEVFEKHGSVFWLEFGTLLGCIREKGFIPHDGDIDLGMDYEDWNSNIITDLCSNGFTVRKEINRLTDSRLLEFVGDHKKDAATQAKLGYRYKNDMTGTAGIKICIEIYHQGIGQKEDMMYFWPTPKPNWIFEMPKDYIVPQIKTDFCGLEVHIPKNYEANLEFMYGKSWKVPNINYPNSEEHMENSKKFRRYLK